MFECATYFILGLLVFQAVRRISSAVEGNAPERHLSAFFAASVGVWMMRIHPELAQLAGVNDLPTLIRHSLSIVCLCLLLRYQAAVYLQGGDGGQDSSQDRRLVTQVHRLATKSSAVSIALMTVIFIFGLDHIDRGGSFLTDHAGQPWLAGYMGTFYVYFAATAVSCSYLWASSARRAPHWPLRWGLRVMSFAFVLGVAYAIAGIVYFVAISFHPSYARLAEAQQRTSDELLYAFYGLFLIGTMLPVGQHLTHGWRAHRTLATLYPLWRELTLAVPGHSVRAPSNRLAGRRGSNWLNWTLDHMRLQPADLRLERYVTEISDVIRTLGYYAPDKLYSRATELAKEQGHHGDEARALAGAYWIRAALTVKEGGRCLRRTPLETPSRIGDDYDEYVSRLLNVCRVLDRSTPEAISSLLRSGPAESPGTD
ncbi:MAB_1171c family putative transporter [Streptomyces sp. NPDC015125]|uniref:MAB_1171c family putative transporter n=1 Tax=Streptomyces sp. NPDC015125 TaxID=3364938 RepID=UPI003701BE9B